MRPLLDPVLLATFVRAAHSGSLSATALQVGRTQSAVTMQMQRLESLVGQSLFHRSGAGVRLTGDGQRFLVHAERILKAHDEALTAFSGGGLRGSIVFGCPEDYLFAFFPNLLKSFGMKYPEVEIRIVAAPTHELRTLLHSRQIDLALISISNPQPKDEVIRTEAMVWVGNKPTLAEHGFGEIVPLALPAANAMDHRDACNAMAKAGLRYKIAYASNSIAGLMTVARSGLAISVMTRRPVPPDLYVLGDPLPPLMELGVKIAFSEAELSAPAAAFADYIAQILPQL